MNKGLLFDWIVYFKSGGAAKHFDVYRRNKKSWN